MHAEVTVHGDGEQEDGTTRRVGLGDQCVVGRSSGCELRLAHDQVSRRHVLLTLGRDGLHVSDLGSRNGTRAGVRDLAPSEIWLLPPGESIGIGPYRLEAVLVGFTELQREITQRWRWADTEALPKDYELIGLLGEGGQSRVWEGRRKSDGLQVAIKVLHASGGEEERARFSQEGELCRRINSPHVVKAYEMGVFAGRPYMVMELVLGTTVGRLLGRGAMEMPAAVSIMEDVTRGLGAAHALGVIHRDVKPSNVLVTAAGVGKLTDFGIAKLTQGDHLTESGLGLGSLPYVAPEQALEAKAADERADLYGVGATLFHMITGEPPFRRPGRGVEGLRAIMEAIACAVPPPLASLREGVPMELSQLVTSLLEKDPLDRPENARQVASRMAQIRQAHGLGVEEDWGTQTDQIVRGLVSGTLESPGDDSC